jgi:hypothetical protein
MLRFGTGKHMAFNVDAKYLTVPSIQYSPNPFYLNHGHGEGHGQCKRNFRIISYHNKLELENVFESEFD